METFKAYLVRDRVFLRQLYEGPNPLKNTRIIFTASETEINTLIKFIHYVCNGKITLAAKDFAAIKNKRKLSFIVKNFEKREALENLLHKDIQYKKSLLIQLSVVYPYLLSTLFVMHQKQGHGVHLAKKD